MATVGAPAGYGRRPAGSPDTRDPGVGPRFLWPSARVCCCFLLTCLLDRDGGASALQGGPRLVRALLVDLLQHRLGRAVHQVLGLLQAQAGQAAHLLDDLDLLVARGLQDDVELVLLLGLLGLAAARAASRGSGHRDGRGRLNVERLLELLDELGQLQEGHLLERLEQVGATHLRHVVVPSLSLRYVGVRLRPPRLLRLGLRWPGLRWPGLRWPGLRWPGLRWPGLRLGPRRLRAWRAEPRRAGPSGPAAR